MQIIYRPAFNSNIVAKERKDQCWRESERAVERYLNLFGISRDSVIRSADYEDWHETSSMLFAAIDTGLPVYVMERHSNEPSTAKNIRARFNTNSTDPAKDEPTILIGRLLKKDPWRDELDVVLPKEEWKGSAERYWENPAFSTFSGRNCAVAYAWDEDESNSGGNDDIVSVIQEMCSGDNKNLALKIINRSKHAPVNIILFDDLSRQSIKNKLFVAFEWDMIHVEGSAPKFLVQDALDIEVEYRTVMIGGKVVTGAGCIESFCPLWNGDESFSRWIEKERGSGVIEQNHLLSEDFRIFAEKVALEMQAHDSLFQASTIDMAKCRDGRIVLLETNPLENYGLYAMNTNLIMQESVRIARDLAADNNHQPEETLEFK